MAPEFTASAASPNGTRRGWRELVRTPWGKVAAWLLGLLLAFGVTFAFATWQQSRPPAQGAIRGTFVAWLPIDSARGYAVVTIANEGDKTNDVSCTVTVRTDFGDQGFEILTGKLEPGERHSQRIGLTVTGNAARLVTRQSIDCD